MNSNRLNPDEFSDRLMKFDVQVLRICDSVDKSSFTALHISKQLIRSVTSIGANFEEARGAESKADFAHKIRISLKESRETLYWLRLIGNLKYHPHTQMDKIIGEANEICAM